MTAMQSNKNSELLENAELLDSRKLEYSWRNNLISHKHVRCNVSLFLLHIFRHISQCYNKKILLLLAFKFPICKSEDI